MSKVDDILNEIAIMQKLQHPRLLQLYDAFQEPTRMILILEFLTGGELFYRVVNTEYSERTCKFYLIQLCEALSFMHSNQIIHLDLKPENILLVNPTSNKIKVIDFGLAREQKPGESLKVLWGTAEFVAPEVINYEEISTTTDMWSVGVITYILLSGISPFMGENMGETYGNVVNVRYDFEDDSFETCSPEAKVFIQDLLIKEQSKRISAETALKHKWLQEITSNIGKSFNKTKLKNYLLRRKWRRAINGVIALQLMGANLDKRQ
ncbi:myosin light chain kinase, smooth muscle-like [Convolutriloba macropyga]|uniref:myosin light chain kinase, smooth muscle-like n=1 Tax=Convolutriloba macropyga TaxID=536237 RepID=UPI003F5228AE